MSDNTYNGWTNYETWLVNLWMDNSQGDQEYWQETAQECMQEAIDNDESDIRNSTTYALSKRMEDQYDEMHTEVTGITGVFADLLGHALGMVDWYEIAKHYTDDTDLFSAGWNMPGYMPESEPAMFLDSDSAMEYIVDSAKDSIPIDNDNIPDLAQEDYVDSWKADSNGEFGQTFGAYHYFINRL